MKRENKNNTPIVRLSSPFMLIHQSHAFWKIVLLKTKCSSFVLNWLYFYFCSSRTFFPSVFCQSGSGQRGAPWRTGCPPVLLRWPSRSRQLVEDQNSEEVYLGGGGLDFWKKSGCKLLVRCGCISSIAGWGRQGGATGLEREERRGSTSADLEHVRSLPLLKTHTHTHTHKRVCLWGPGDVKVTADGAPRWKDQQLSVVHDWIQTR